MENIEPHGFPTVPNSSTQKVGAHSPSGGAHEPEAQDLHLALVAMAKFEGPGPTVGPTVGPLAVPVGAPEKP